MAWWETVLIALWLFLPAYVANMAPPIVAKILPRWNTAIDGGRLAKDGKPLLGKSKTWRGLVGAGVLAGLTAVGMAFVAPHWDLVEYVDFGMAGYQPGTAVGTPPYCPLESFDVNISCPTQHASLAAIFAFGAIVGVFAIVGDAVKSYFKRRRGKEGGAPWVPFDQLDFVVFGILGMFLASPLLPQQWVVRALTEDWLVLATLLLLTPVLHFAVNILGYLLRLKKVPW